LTSYSRATSDVMNPATLSGFLRYCYTEYLAIPIMNGHCISKPKIDFGDTDISTWPTTAENFKFLRFNFSNSYDPRHIATERM